MDELSTRQYRSKTVGDIRAYSQPSDQQKLDLNEDLGYGAQLLGLLSPQKKKSFNPDLSSSPKNQKVLRLDRLLQEDNTSDLDPNTSAAILNTEKSKKELTTVISTANQNTLKNENILLEQSIQIESFSLDSNEMEFNQHIRHAESISIKEIRFHKELSFSIFLIYVSSILTVLTKISSKYLLILAIILLLAQIYRLNFSKTDLPRKRSKLLFQTLDLILLIMFCVISFIRFESKIHLSLFTLPGFAISFIYFIKPIKREFKNYTYLVERIILWLQLLILSLKIDGMDIDLAISLLLLFFIGFAGIIMCATMLIVFIFVFFKLIESRNYKTRSIGIFWYFLQLSYNIPLIGSLFGLRSIVENNDNGSLTNFLIGGMGHSLLLLLYTIFFSKYIKIFIVHEQSDDIDQARSTTQVMKFKMKKRENSSTYLFQISPTYFSTMKDFLKMKSQDPNTIKKQKIRTRGVTQNSRNRPEEVKAKNLSSSLNLKNNPMNGVGHNRFSHDDAAWIEMKKQEEAEEFDNLCFVCVTKAPDGVFMDCGHGGICFDCGIIHWKKGDGCLICRNPIKNLLKVKNLADTGVIKIIGQTEKIIEAKTLQYGENS